MVLAQVVLEILRKNCRGAIMPPPPPILIRIKAIGEFEMNNNVSVNVLAVEGRDIYIHRKSNYKSNREINLLMISEGPTGPSGDGIQHYTAIKSLSRLLSSKSSKHHGKQYFCNNCLQGFKSE